MATATKKPHPAPPPPDRRATGGLSIVSAVVRACDAVYRFLASLKLAVLSLGTLAGVLAYATFFEKWYGTAAVQEWIYRGTFFSVLLAFLAANILCAALIRYPWKKRQTGFVITHAGLLVLLAGSFYSVKTSDEGQVAALEGEVKEEIVRNDYPVVRVKQMDRTDPAKVEREWELPFRPGAFAWGPGRPRPASVVDTLLSPIRGADRSPTDVLTRPKDAFQFVVKSHIPASVPAVKHVADPSGSPMVKIRPRIKAPGMTKMSDVLDEGERWFTTDGRLYKVVKSQGPAQFAFYYVDKPEMAEEFLNPPADAGEEGVARFRYADKDGKARKYDWSLDGQAGKTVTLPDSDLKVKFVDVLGFPAAEAGLAETLGESSVPIAEFQVSRGDGDPVKHFALASLPMFPNVIPGEKASKPLLAVSYFLPPVLDPAANRRFGLVEVLGTPDGSLYYRVFGRGASGKTRGEVRSKGPVTKGKELVAFGGNSSTPMTLSFEVEDYFTAGKEVAVCEPIVLPAGQMGNGIPASLVEMTVPDPDDPTKTLSKEFYIRRSASLDPVWQTVTFGPADRPDKQVVYKVGYDSDRRPLGFELKMVDFQRGFDPGTEKASRFSSDVLLTDKAQGIENKKIHISMNEPLTHRGYTFYQSSFVREEDPRTGRETGRVQSVLQVGLNPGRRVMYAGCLLVVLGAFAQFYMRAGVFSDGGRREREKEKAAAVRRARAGGLPVDPALLVPEPATSVRGDEPEEAL